MNKIKFSVNKDTNYVFHMLSVAGCGYDNTYGKRYCSQYPQEELNILKMNESLITVCGGEHCGCLYGLLAAQPACADVPVPEYYSALTETGKKIKAGDIPEGISSEILPYTDTVISISEVMLKHYNHYIENIWENEKEKIEKYAAELQSYFEKSDFTEKAESLLGCSLKSGYFTAELVSSTEGGAEAIDISESQDVFGIERDLLDSVYFIGHEFIIYLLFEALDGENAFKSLETWSLTEGLAEYYLKKIMGDTRFFTEQLKYVKYFENCEKEFPMSVAELYRKALKANI